VKLKALGATVGWLTRASRYIHESRWSRVRQDQVEVHGKEHTFTWMELAGSVFVVPVTKQGRIVLLRSYRYNVDDWVWELPAGGIGDKMHLTLEEAARAEMLEETGYSGGVFEELSHYYSAVGALDLKFTIFLARGVERVQARTAEESEEIAEVVELTLEEAVARAHSGSINDGESALAILLAAERLCQV
jgi:ADP-ribose pyrophosphatase